MSKPCRRHLDVAVVLETEQNQDREARNDYRAPSEDSLRIQARDGGRKRQEEGGRRLVVQKYWYGGIWRWIDSCACTSFLEMVNCPPYR